jgi:uncharacterized lipoprotein YddW (UPF0748 family)
MAFLVSCPMAARAQTEEFRAFWVDAFHPGFKNSSEVTTLINQVRAANCNGVVVELRKRGDAYYRPNTSYADYEPHASDTSPADFDSLADLIAKAHDTSGGKQRVEVHVWIVTWPIWGSSTSFPTNPQHPYNRHPEWFTQDNTGATWNGSQYCLDPGHPGAFNHTYRIAINLVTNYDVDGINFDYVRYAGNTWGYNPTAVSRFRSCYGGSGNPANTDPNWLQFRRDQITAFVRKVYLNTLAHKPNVKVSADTITWAPGPTGVSAWYSSSAAWKSVLQDWRGWMQEGILDLNIPMAYFDQGGAYTQDWTNWCNFTRDNQYNRHAALGPGIYLNSVSEAITQMRYIRVASPSGNRVRGICGYSYAVPNNESVDFSTFLGYLTSSPNAYDPEMPGVFDQPVPVPAMPWKTSPTYGHLMGTVLLGGTSVDGAVVNLAGPINRSQTNDSSGFYGFVDLPAGTYRVWTRSSTGTVTNNVSITVGVVTTSNLLIPTVDTVPPTLSSIQAINLSDSGATIAWDTDESADSLVEYGPTVGYGSAVTNTVMTLDHALNLSGLAGATLYHYRVKSADAAGNQAVSEDRTFTTNPSGVVNDLIIDNPAARVVGSWSTGTMASDRYGSDYQYKSQGSGAAYLQFTPLILTAGNYRVYEWHSAGSNRSTNGPYAVTFFGGNQTIYMDQQVNGGQWNLLGTYNFAAGTSGYVRVTDAFADGGKVVIADAIKFAYVPPTFPPTIVSQPRDQTIKVGSNAVFSVTANGTTPLAYQWYFNASAIAGANAPTCTRWSVQTNHAGAYRVIITNTLGAVTSQVATLTVLPLQPPVITAQPWSLAAVPGGSALFSVSAMGTGTLCYQWRHDGAEMSGETLPSLALSDLLPAQFGTYTVLVSNEDGSALSDPALLTTAVPPLLLASQDSGPGLTLSFATERGPVYALEYAESLYSPQWQVLTNFSGTGTPVSLVEDTTAKETRFYRVHAR